MKKLVMVLVVLVVLGVMAVGVPVLETGAQSGNCYTYCCGVDGAGRCVAWCTRCY